MAYLPIRGSNWSRRRLLVHLASVPLASCVSPPKNWTSFVPPTGPPLVDAHCHLFNITDLPAASFIQRVFAKDYEHPGPPRPAEVLLRGALEGIEQGLSINVITAAQEADLRPGSGFLSPEAPPLTAPQRASLEQHLSDAERALARLHAEQLVADCGSSGPSSNMRTVAHWLGDLRSARATIRVTLQRLRMIAVWLEFRPVRSSAVGLYTWFRRIRAPEFGRRDWRAISRLIGRVSAVSADGFGSKIPQISAFIV